MVNGQVGSTQEILRNCTLTLDNHAFLVDLMPMVIGSFDTIICMDWLSHTHVKVLCFEKVLRPPLPNGEPLIIHGDKPDKNLTIISCMKDRKNL